MDSGLDRTNDVLFSDDDDIYPPLSLPIIRHVPASAPIGRKDTLNFYRQLGEAANLVFVFNGRVIKALKSSFFLNGRPPHPTPDHLVAEYVGMAV